MTVKPSQETKPNATDPLGRTWSDVLGCWFTSDIEIPIGSRVTVLPDRFDSGRTLFVAPPVGVEAIVVNNQPANKSSFNKEILLRRVEPVNEMEPGANFFRYDQNLVSVLKVGSGKVIPGEDYTLCRKEILDRRYAEMDHRMDGFANPATACVALSLWTDQSHQRAIEGMIRQNGTINPKRLENYWYKTGLKLDDWAKTPEGFPERNGYDYTVNWKELAEEFAFRFQEIHAKNAQQDDDEAPGLSF